MVVALRLCTFLNMALEVAAAAAAAGSVAFISDSEGEFVRPNIKERKKKKFTY